MKDYLKVRLVLMELVIAILFFSISVSVCIQLFVSAYIRSRDAQQLNQSVFIAQGIAEVYKNYQGDIEDVATYYDAEVSNSGWILYLDTEGNPCKKELQKLQVTFTEQQPDTNQLMISIENEKEEIYTMNVLAYQAQIGGQR